MKWLFRKLNVLILGIVPIIVMSSAFVYWLTPTQSTAKTVGLIFIICSLFIALTRLLLYQNKLKYKQIQALKISETQLSMALEASQIGIWDWDILTNQVTWSRGHEQLFGLKPGTFNGTYETFEAHIYPEDREALRQVVNRAIQEKIDYLHQYRVVWSDHSIHWIEGRGKAIYSEAGEAVRMTGTVMDICDRKIAEAKIQIFNTELEQRVLERTANLIETNQELEKKIAERQLLEQKLHSSEAQMRRVFEAMNDIVLVIDTETGSINVAPTNPVCLHESATDIISKTIELIFQNDTTDDSFNPIQQALEAQQTINFDYKLSLDASEVWFTASISPLLNNSVIWVARDITERRAIETMKNEFISIVSHELRTPLTSIRGSLGLLATGILNNQPQRVKRLIEIASIDTERLVRLVNDILDLERLESGKIILVKESCDVDTLMRQSIEVMRSLAEQENIILSIYPVSAQVWAAPDSIIQVLANLVGNAIKFSPAHSAITIFAERKDDWVLFQVKDQGRGIPSDKLEKIFGRFQQVDASDSRSKGGTGLGLAICQSIVEQHGGRIWVESVLGSGSIFYFTLPRFVQ